MLKMRKLMGALILEGVVQVAQDAQDVFGPHGGAVFSIEELGVVLQYWSVLISNFRIARNGRERRFFTRYLAISMAIRNH